MRSFIIISRTVFKLQSGHEYTAEKAMFSVQMVITPKVGIPELRFMFSASRLIVLYICVKFRKNIGRTRVEYIVEMAIFNIYYIQRAPTPKVV